MKPLPKSFDGYVTSAFLELGLMNHSKHLTIIAHKGTKEYIISMGVIVLQNCVL